MKWIKQAFQRIFTHDSQDTTGNELTHVQSLPELTNADLEFLFTQLLEGVYQARGQQWALRYLQRMDNRISEQRWLEWLQMFGSRVLNSPAPNDELAFRMVQLSELNIGIIGELSGNIGMQLLARTTNPDEWETSDIFDATVTEVPAQSHQVSDSNYVTESTPHAVEIPVPQVLNNTNNILFDFNFQPANQDRYEWEINPEENALIALDNTPGQDLLRQFGDELWEVGIDEPDSSSATQMESLQIDEQGIQFVEFASPTLDRVERETELAELLEDDIVAASQSTHQTDLVEEIQAPINPEAIELDVSAQLEADADVTNLAAVENELEHELTQETETEVINVRSPEVEEVEEYAESLDELEYTETNDLITPNPIWQQEWTGVEPPDVIVTLDELWVRLQQSANLVEQLAAGLVSQSDTPILLDTPTQTVDPEAEAQKLFYQGLQQSKSGDLIEAIASYDAALELQPDAYEYWFNRGLALFYCGDLMAALASYEQAIAIKEDYYKAWLNRGGTLGELDQFDQAIASFDRAIALKSDEYDAWSGRGTALLKLGRIEEAVQSYDIATQLQPNDGQTWFYRGVALANLGEYPDAIASFDEALETESNYHLIWHQRGIAQVNINQWEDAIASYDQALELSPQDADIWIARAYALDRHQQPELAIASYSQALAINPQLDHIWIDRGVLQANLGQWEEAIQSWQEAIAISPHLYLAYFNQAVAWDNLGNTQQALICYNQALDIEPNFHIGWYNRGLLLFKQQQIEAAILSYDLAIQVQPDYWEAWLARANAVEKSPGYDTYFTNYSALANSNPSLNLRGYDGKLTTYNEALTYLNPETHPEGWGKINLGLGATYYERGLYYRNPRHDWYHAFDAYNQARVTLTPDIFPEQHLEVLQNLIKIYVAFEQTADAHALYEHARNFLDEQLRDSQRQDADKQRLALQFAGIAQLGVDIAVQSGELVQALEIGEYFKNACLNWLLNGWSEHILSPNHATIQHLVNPHTAIIYWHFSPVAIHTFIIKHLHPEPIPVFTPILNLEEYDETPLPESVERFVKFRVWLEEWQQQYSEYLSLSPTAKSEHTWRVDMLPRLLQLKQILNINNIVQELEGITNLILIPHRYLFSLPLHALFSLSASLNKSEIAHHNFQITYLPTAQTALIKDKTINPQSSYNSLLSLENYDNLDQIAQKFTRLENDIIAEYFPSERIQTENINPQTLQQTLNSNFDIFNFSGVVSEHPQNPTTSSLQIHHTQFKVSEINHPYRLVTLTTHHHQPDSSPINSEYAGIAIALYAQGVAYIQANSWEVEATTRILIMVEFYRLVNAGKPPITAFNEAIDWLKELTPRELQKWYEGLFNQSLPAYITAHLDQTSQIDPDTKLYSHPFHWAAWKMIGSFE